MKRLLTKYGIIVLSVAVVAIPGGIFSAGFVAEFQKREKGETPHDADE